MEDSRKNKYYIITIVVLILILIVGVRYYVSQLQKTKLDPLEQTKTELLQKQTKSSDSSLVLIEALRDSLKIEKNKPPIIIPRYNEKIIYKSINDDAIINVLSRERRNYLQKQQR